MIWLRSPRPTGLLPPALGPRRRSAPAAQSHRHPPASYDVSGHLPRCQCGNQRKIPTTSFRPNHRCQFGREHLSQAFEIEFEGGDFRVERQLIDQAFTLHRTGKLLAVLIDDAHLMPMDCLRRLRLLFEEFPRNHNVVLFSQAEMLRTLRLTVNQDLHSRLTYSATLRKLAPDALEAFVLGQFDRCGLPHATLTPEALALIARASDGVLRAARNLTLATLIEAVRAQKKQAGLELVNKALMQPHWRSLDELR